MWCASWTLFFEVLCVFESKPCFPIRLQNARLHKQIGLEQLQFLQLQTSNENKNNVMS